jgi:hypothetical protein
MQRAALYYALLLVATSCASPGGKPVAIDSRPDGSQLYTFAKTNETCVKRADYTRFISTSASTEIRQVIKGSFDFQTRMEKAREISPKFEELQAVFFDLCYEFGSGRMERTEYDRLRKVYEEIRVGLFESPAILPDDGGHRIPKTNPKPTPPGDSVKTAHSGYVTVPKTGASCTVEICEPSGCAHCAIIETYIPANATIREIRYFIIREDNGQPKKSAIGQDERWARFINPQVREVPGTRVVGVTLMNWRNDLDRSGEMEVDWTVGD